MAKKNNEKRIRITPQLIETLSRARGMTLDPTDLQDGLDPNVDGLPEFAYGCVDVMTYDGTPARLTSIELLGAFGQIDRLVASGSDGFLTENLDDYGSIFERAADHGHEVTVKIGFDSILQITVRRCGCPCDKRHASDYPDEDGIAGGVDSVDRL